MLSIRIVLKSLVVFSLASCFISCEKDDDQQIEIETSKPFRNSIIKAANDLYAQWDNATNEPLFFKRQGNRVQQVVNENSGVHPDYQRLLDDVEQARIDLEVCFADWDYENSQEITPSCDYEERVYDDAEEALQSYVNAGLPQQITSELFEFTVVSEDSNFVRIKDGNRNIEIRLPIHSPGEPKSAYILENGTFRIWKSFIYRECANDNIRPNITCSNLTVQKIPIGRRLTDLSDYVSAADNCALASITQSSDSGSDRIVDGHQNITFVATDKNGNTSSCVMTVIGECTNAGVAPTITCGITNNQSVSNGSRIPDYRNLFSAVDHCGKNLSLVQLPSPGTILQAGIQVVTITATDQFGNASECIFNINVQNTGCSAPNIGLNLGSNLCFLSSFRISASGERADQYEWRVSGNANVGIMFDGRLILANSNVTIPTPNNYVNIYTGNGVTSFDGTKLVSPPGNRIYIQVRGRKNGCAQWSPWRFVNTFTNNCTEIPDLIELIDEY